ncbi:hypothetical protein SAMN02745857_01943 [Andreprevotia lacus DSM 23236]|jgi:ABC-type glutathione transport system ATPase component|uniref:Uncharacterized protein n=1 Tax=Andreprevotia lacus DSM 23236 TaxID=1121001 RepID=A0A1W1XMI1_9NEIS|nr:hypothetical protein [Andreprevotia lacus]SMC24738.1 hypothetical protein SAMN02745857_01943 [Andreprevotia lacus DSM 23236]
MSAPQTQELDDLIARLAQCRFGESHALVCDDALAAALLAALHVQQPGQAVVLDFRTSLLSNLRVWENLILPAWYHGHAELQVLEQRVLAALRPFKLDDEGIAALLDGLPAALSATRKQELVLLRTLVLAPRYVLVEPAWLRRVRQTPLGAELWQAIEATSVVLQLGEGAAPDLPVIGGKRPEQGQE